MVFTAVSMVPWPEIIITGTRGFFSFMTWRTATPSIPGSQMSKRTRSTACLEKNSRASSPVAASATLYPSSSRTPLRDSLMVSSSSTTSTRLPIYAAFPGSSITKTAPLGLLSLTLMYPPWSEMILLTMASPRPVPLALVEK